ncbi:transcription antitermination factor NusB, partial [Streptomyces sp. NPDC050704]|uniref:transcription antitermination factor NusB n=1 Tax=Streptomyces sp. NPDC050704 TaxID=3157219 RepID=UPI00342BFA2E
MAARNTARKRAFQILFEGDQRGVDVQTVLGDWIRHARTDTRQPPVSEYTMQLVEGYAKYERRIDDLISQYAVGWTLDRMPVVAFPARPARQQLGDGSQRSPSQQYAGLQLDVEL